MLVRNPLVTRCILVALALGGAVHCTVNAEAPTEVEATAGTGGSSAGAAAAVTEGGEAGEGGAAGAPEPACANLPAQLEKDATFGPGCVTAKTVVVTAGTLTLKPGTTVQMARGGSIEVQSGGALSALGTTDAPILFTSAAKAGAAGDWGCIALDSGSVDSALNQVQIEFGGADCGLSTAASLQIGASINQLTNIEVRNGLGHGLRLSSSARGIRQLHDLKFSAIEKTSLYVTPEAMNALKAPIALDGDDTYVDVDSGAILDVEHDVTWHNITVPYRFDGAVDVEAGLTIEPGTTLYPTAGVYFGDTPNTALNAVGTATQHIRWTSLESKPAPGDWGCLDFWVEKQVTLDYNDFEYGGACSYGDHSPVILIESGPSSLGHLSFKADKEVGIQDAWNCPTGSNLAAICAFSYVGVTTPLFCGGMAACP